jgi:hypothetical protein
MSDRPPLLGLHLYFHPNRFGNHYGEAIWEHLVPVFAGLDFAGTFVRVGDVRRGAYFCIALFPRDGRQLHGVARKVTHARHLKHSMAEPLARWEPPNPEMNDLAAIDGDGWFRARHPEACEGAVREALGLFLAKESNPFFSVGDWHREQGERDGQPRACARSSSSPTASAPTTTSPRSSSTKATSRRARPTCARPSR